MRRFNGMVWIAGLAALALAGGPAAALTPHSLESGASMVRPVMDQEDLSVEEDMEPGEVPGAMKDSGDKAMPAPDRRGVAGDMEDDAVKKDLETGE